jgi:exopolyphosphatase/guanosine-5'-triphosphate,3'-diphosphate pyrophosphatase
MLTLAAIDIGSNAIRIQLSRVIEYEGQITFKKLEYVRFPLRLGQDVFTKGEISESSKAKFLKLMQAFKILIDLYEVDDYMACATSAMRDSINGASIIAEVKKMFGLSIEIINGEKEAEIINKAIFPHMDFQTYLHIDVGGGSTELNLYVAHEKVAAKSFQVGSVRRLSTTENSPVWMEMENWIKKQVKLNYGKVQAIGTGGNINKVLDMANKKPGKSISIQKIKEVQTYIAGY